MTPQNIANLLTNLKSKAKIHASNSRSYNVYEKRDATDEMKAEVQDMNSCFVEIYASMDAILSDKFKTPFSTDQWFDAMLDNRRFTEPNPRLVYEEKIRENERSENEERINTFKNICKSGPEDKTQVITLINNGFNIEKDGNIYDVDSLFKMGRSIEFIEFLVEEGMKLVENDLQKLAQQKAVFSERIKKEQEEADRKKREELELQQKEQEIADKKKQDELELQKNELLQRLEKLKIQRADERQKLQEQKEEEQRRLYHKKKSEYKEICNNGPDDITKINDLINSGFDIQKDGRIYDISTLFQMGRSIQFIELLIRAGMKTYETDLKELEIQRAIINQRIKKEQKEAERKKEAELERKQKEQEEFERKKEAEFERKQNELFQRQEKERIEQFKKLCNEYSNHLPDNSQNESVRSLKKLIEQGLDIRKINNFDIIECCINNGKSKRFLQIVVEAGAFVKAKHLKQFYNEYDKLQEELTAKKLFVSPSSFNHINWKIEILENAKNLEDKAILLISKRKRLDKIKGIIVLSVFILAIIIIVLYNIT